MAFSYKDERLHCENVDLKHVADEHGTPVYVYSESILRRNAEVIKASFLDRGFKASYAMKANSNPAILELFKSYGLGVDIVSGGELQMAQHLGFHGSQINYAGVGKTEAELEIALDADVAYFNVESRFELLALDAKAGLLGKKANVLLRLNPDIDPQTHPHISTGLKQNKFGMDAEKVSDILKSQESFENINFEGIHCHIGSQILTPQPFYDLIDYLAQFVAGLEQAGVKISQIDMGGGFGVDYMNPFVDILETTPYLDAFAEQAVAKLGQYQLHIQPGRVLVANAAVLLTQILGNKQNGEYHFTVVDGATTDLIRPALYDAYHAIYAHRQHNETRISDVVGPVCESSDALANQREIPIMDAGELIAVASAGAYSSSMGSTYNMRPLSPEVMISKNGEIDLIRRRQTFDEMISLY